MKRLFSLSAAALLFSIGAVGCQNTAEGAKQDTANDAAAVKDAGDKAVVGTEQAAQAAKDKAAQAAAATKAAGEKAVVGTERAAAAAKDQASQAAAATAQAADHAVTATEKAADHAVTATEKAADHAAAATEKATDRAVSATEKAGKNASDAVTLQPKVKDAIDNDTQLSNNANVIHVETGNGIIALVGHVKTKEMKDRAASVAKKAVQASGSNDQVVNSLTVGGQ